MSDRTAWSDPVLDALRREGDPAMDDAIAQFAQEYGGRDPRHLVRAVFETVDPRHPATASGLLADILEDPDPLPHWIDRDQLARGQRFFRAHGLPIAASLFCASLPVAYAAGDGARVIAVTGDLISDTRRRIAETAHMIVAVMDLSAEDLAKGIHPLAPTTRGFHAARGVRAMHATVRHFMVTHPIAIAHYDPDTHGVPVNQEDLIGTLLTFTTVVFAALRRLGIRVKKADAEAYMHTWSVVGHLLGIRPDLLPIGVDEARDLDLLIRRRLNRPSDDGRKLMLALRDEMTRSMPTIPGARGYPDALVHRLIGREMATDLGIPEPGRSRHLVRSAVGLSRVVSLIPGANFKGAAGELVARPVIRRYVDEGKGQYATWDFSSVIDEWRLERLRERRSRRPRGTR